VYTVGVEPPVPSVTYSMSAGGAGYFHIDATGGQLSYAGPVSAEHDLEYHLVVS
jgi:hypothetical protein